MTHETIGDSFRKAEMAESIAKDSKTGKKIRYIYTIELQDAAKTIKDIETKFNYEVGEEITDAETAEKALVLRREIKDDGN